MKQVEMTASERVTLFHLHEINDFIDRIHLNNRENVYGSVFLDLRRELQLQYIELEYLYDIFSLIRWATDPPDPNTPIDVNECIVNGDFL